MDQFLSACVYARERVNPFVFSYAASVAILHRRDTRNVPLPANVEVFPELYVDSAVFGQAREEVSLVPVGSRVWNGLQFLKIYKFLEGIMGTN